MKEITFGQAINEALREALVRDPSVFLMGEDIGPYGGSFGVTTGLFAEFGADSIIDTPISETVFVGIACGAAITGMRPIVEIMFIDWITLAWDGLFNHASKVFYMSGGQAKCPVVIRTTSGAGGGAGAHHSQSLHAWAMHAPGLKVAIPSTPYDAKGLLSTAIEDNNAVLFIEDRELYGTKGEIPEGYYTIPFGEATVRKEGTDITVVATARMVAKALSVAEELEGEGTSIEVIDPRTLYPLDKETIIDSVKKTGRLITFDEGCKNNGMGSEIAAIIAEEAIDYLQAPIIRVAAPMVPVPSSKALESFYIPDEGNLKEAITRILHHG
ncbi:alpha-ketoacid dehydrogenase subunit beta [bacterium]|nr:alpha-ketoacid dehydrogenase subunit beta [bacterium]